MVHEPGRAVGLALCLGFLISLVSCAGTTGRVSRTTDPENEAVVVVRLKGTVMGLPGFFAGEQLHQPGGENFEILGFEIAGRNGIRVRVRPLERGFVAKAVPAGDYVLRRVRRDRPSGDGEGEIEILSFSVRSGELVNLGTVKVVLEGPPLETLRMSPGYRPGTFDFSMVGIYLYTYRYERVEGEASHAEPMEWFRDRHSEVYGRFRNGSTTLSPAVTSESDRSVFTVEQFDWK